jgi:RNA polymerase sigma-70 factor (ECF subfamily)
MVIEQRSETDELLNRAARGDLLARQEILVRHRDRLRKMIGLRMDHRLAARIDPSDVVQETLAEAVQKLPEYLRRRPLPFYPWLRQLACEKLITLHRRHMAQKRSVRREEHPPLPDDSVLQLAERVAAEASTPSSRLHREELRPLVRAALAQLSDTDREVLVLRHLEQLSAAEISAIMGITEGAFYMRHVRALKRIRSLLSAVFAERES